MDQPNDSRDTHDRIQDAKIVLLEDQIRRLLSDLHEIHDHFIPPDIEEKENRWKKLLFRTGMKIVLVVSVIVGGWDFGGWYLDRLEIQQMARRYASVAEDIYYKENNPEIALSFLARAIDLNEGNPEFRFTVAYIEGMAAVRELMNLDRPLNKEELDRAHEALAQALFLRKIKPRRAESFILEGQIQAALKENTKAREALKKARSIDPENEFVHLRLGTLLVNEGGVSEGMKEIDEAIRLEPDFKWGWLWKGIVLMDHQHDPLAARDAYDRALQIDDRFDLALYNKAWTYISGPEKDYKTARDLLERALQINPDYKEACYALGMVYGYQDRYDVAAAYLDQAIRLDQDFLTAYKWRAIVAMEMGQYEEARSFLDDAIRLSPRNSELYVRRAKTFEETGDLNKATSDLRFAIESDPQDPKSWLYLGSIFAKTGAYERALEQYDKALEIKPDYDDACAGRADALLGLGREDDAIAAITAAIDRTTYRPERFLLQRGRMQRERGNTHDALSDFREARVKNPEKDEAWFLEAELALELGLQEEAENAVARFLELKPADLNGKDLAARIGQLPAPTVDPKLRDD